MTVVVGSADMLLRSRERAVTRWYFLGRELECLGGIHCRVSGVGKPEPTRVPSMRQGLNLPLCGMRL
jgi:hypothetical protein